MALNKISAGWLRRLGNRTYLPALLALAVVCAAGYYAERQNDTIHYQSERARVQQQAGLIKSSLEGQLNGDYQRLRGLAAMLATEPDMPQARFSQIAEQVLMGQTAIRHIAAAPGLVVSLIYPIKGNEPAIGLDYTKTAAQREAAYRVRDSGEMVLAGPVNLVQGGTGFIYRLPIFTGPEDKKEFWGILSAVVETKTLYAETGVTGGAQTLEIALTGKDGTGAAGQQFLGTAEIPAGEPVLMDINLPVGSWQLAARPAGGWQAQPGNLWQLRLALLAAGTLIVFPTFLAGRLSAARQTVIGQLRRREAELEAVSRRLEIAVKTSRVGIWECDAGNKRVSWDSRMHELYGVPREQGPLAGSAWIARLHPQDRDRVVKSLEAAERAKTNFASEFRILLDDGSVKHIRALASPFTDTQGRSWMIGVNWNVSEDVRLREELIHANQALSERNTELKEGKRALEEAHAELQKQQAELHRLSLVAKHASDSIILTDGSRKILWVNDAFTRATGYGADEAIGRTPSDLLDGPATDLSVVREMNRHKERGIRYHNEVLNYTKAGEEVWFDTNIVPVTGADGEVDLIIGIERDITRSKQRERELAEAKLAAEHADRAKSEFLANMSHEIRTPMNGIIGMADLLAEADLTADDQQNVETIRSSAQALLKIINDILDLSRLEAGKFAISREDFNLRDCIGGAADLFRPKALEKGLSMQVSYANGLPERLHGDDGRLRQILVNLIGNAVKFTPDGKIAVRVSHAGADRCRLVVEVEDSGIGISEAQASHIFDRFTQADAATTKAFGGTGLGLTISSMLAKRMGGGISVQSQPGKGSCFRLELQMAPASQAPDAEAPALPDAAPQLGPCRVLLAEDNQTNRLLVRKFLRGQPVDLQEAGNGRAAVEMCRELEPDVILMDMSMPELDGISATQEIRSLPIRQPVIVALTANAFSSDRQACLDAGMDHFLAKPVKKTVLLHTLAAVLAEAEDTQRRPRASA
ncbi:PAS domain S-box protein [Leisingera aquaemixtae]|uniref:ATP-binding protein n=1 Tax=Leisingera aquaemixtae TaxID=1396826 RepID=UPI0021A7E6EB|nr:ATP-binding protein [Leisingera aquaemixtae]UWQ36947.1 PAS domain S-box protein [Leisingera aquaemixtae]